MFLCTGVTTTDGCSGFRPPDRELGRLGWKGLDRARRLGENSDGADIPPTPGQACSFGAGNVGEVGGPTGTKSTHRTSTWGPWVSAPVVGYRFCEYQFAGRGGRTRGLRIPRLAHAPGASAKEEAAVEDPSVHPRPVRRSCKPLPAEDEVAAEMRHAPTADLGAVILERVAVIQKVAGTSHNFKGTFVRSLRESALHIQHAAAEQAKWTVGSEREAELERELRELRARLSATEALSRVRDDGAAGDAMGAGAPDASIMPPPPPPVPASARPRRFGRVVAADLAPPSPPLVEREPRKREYGGIRSGFDLKLGHEIAKVPGSRRTVVKGSRVEEYRWGTLSSSGMKLSLSSLRTSGKGWLSEGTFPWRGGDRRTRPRLSLRSARTASPCITTGALGFPPSPWLGDGHLTIPRGGYRGPGSAAAPGQQVMYEAATGGCRGGGNARALASRGSSLLRGFCNSGRPLRPPFNVQLRTGTD
ncbi:hypothetical protein WN55_06261 [Dufourea novaeangliae]|uniref:Uncharacterized protein n=1 Tax=Dufourea novaeangliae TaxID=178035 RepID=A0A154PPV8_DUFNO|nr:hypothetical protein WN55_06261 [Dufourea novaeangliae]